ncbi:restriction endonuclease subunit S [Vagococcus fluvialis]|uniref:restriction endonuclease subunit S n=1 Tax=Vagococcus fluvialis TaxID=2738 RepID=UPI00378D0E65
MIDSKALREKVLDLAFKGNLVSQNFEDEPASKLLKRIQKEKEQLIKEKKIKKEKTLSEISKKEELYRIPENWEWTKLGSIIQLISGRDLTKSEYSSLEEGIPYITGASNFEQGKVKIERWTKHPKVESVKDDILITVKGTVGDMAVLSIPKAHIARQIVAVRNITKDINSTYLFWFLINYKKKLQQSSKGLIPGITRENILEAHIPIPPFAEQQKIVMKIEELFSLIDIIEQESAEYDKLTKYLDIKILNLAMKGKLLPQDSTDEPASDLLEKIKKEKEQLINDKKIKKEKNSPKIIEEEKPYEIPESWEWAKLSWIQDVRDGTHDTPAYIEHGIPLITSKNLINQKICFKDVKFISSDDADKIDKRSEVNNGDILFAMIGTIGNPVIVDIGNQRISIKNVALLKQFSTFNLAEFVHLFLRSQQESMKKNASGGLQKFYSLTMIRNMIIPIPPIEEQHRIINAIKEIEKYL